MLAMKMSHAVRFAMEAAFGSTWRRLRCRGSLASRHLQVLWHATLVQHTSEAAESSVR